MLSPYLVTSSCSSLLLSFVFSLLVLVLLLPPAPFNLEQTKFAQHGYGEINQVWKVRLCCAHMLCFLPSTPSVEKYVQNCCEVPQWRAGTKLPSQSSAMPLSCTETHTELTTNRMPTVNKNKKCLPTQHASTLVKKKKREREIKKDITQITSLSLLNVDVLYPKLVSLHLVWSCGKSIKAEGAASA